METNWHKALLTDRACTDKPHIYQLKTCSKARAGSLRDAHQAATDLAQAEWPHMQSMTSSAVSCDKPPHDNPLFPLGSGKDKGGPSKGGFLNNQLFS